MLRFFLLLSPSVGLMFRRFVLLSMLVLLLFFSHFFSFFFYWYFSLVLCCGSCVWRLENRFRCHLLLFRYLLDISVYATYSCRTFFMYICIIYISNRFVCACTNLLVSFNLSISLSLSLLFIHIITIYRCLRKLQTVKLIPWLYHRFKVIQIVHTDNVFLGCCQ